jgi:hypothetical protein
LSTVSVEVYQLVRTKKAGVLCVLPETLLSLPLPLLLRVKLLAAAAVVNILKLLALPLRDLHCTHIHTGKKNTLLLGKNMVGRAHKRFSIGFCCCFCYCCFYKHLSESLLSLLGSQAGCLACGQEVAYTALLTREQC